MKLYRYLWAGLVLTFCMAAVYFAPGNAGFSQTAPAVQPANVVMVEVDYPRHTDKGTGTLIEKDLILTCYHNIREANRWAKIGVRFSDGSYHSATVVKKDRVHDLALLKIDPVLVAPMKLADRDVSVGDLVTVGGFPRALPYEETSGKVVRRLGPGGQYYMLDQYCIAGMSGGPAMNPDGELVGVLFGSDMNAHCTGLGRVKKFLE